MKRVDHDQSLNFKHIAELEKPDKFKNLKNPVTNVAACRARDEPIFYVLFSNEDFSFVRKYRLEDEINFREDKTSGFITA